MNADEIKTELQNMTLGSLLALLEDVCESQIKDLYGGESIMDHHRQTTNEVKLLAIYGVLKS